MTRYLAIALSTLLLLGCTEPFVFGDGASTGGGGSGGSHSATTASGGAGSTAASSSSSSGGGVLCAIGDSSCVGNDLWSCDDGDWFFQEICAEACVVDQCEIGLLFALRFDALPWADIVSGQVPTTVPSVNQTTGLDGTAAADCAGGHLDFGAPTPSMNALPLTVTAWVRPTDPLAPSGVLLSTASGNNSYAGIWLTLDPTDGGTVAAAFGDGSGTGPNDRFGERTVPGLPTGSWSHVAVVYSSAPAIAIFVDGAAVATTPSGSATSLGGSGVLRVCDGMWGGSQPAPAAADIDDVRIYDRSLSAQEIGELAGL